MNSQAIETIAAVLNEMNPQELNRVIRAAAELVMFRANSNITCAVHQDDFCACYAKGTIPAEILRGVFGGIQEALAEQGLAVFSPPPPGRRADA